MAIDKTRPGRGEHTRRIRQHSLNRPSTNISSTNSDRWCSKALDCSRLLAAAQRLARARAIALARPAVSQEGIQFRLTRATNITATASSDTHQIELIAQFANCTRTAALHQLHSHCLSQQVQFCSADLALSSLFANILAHFVTRD